MNKSNQKQTLVTGGAGFLGSYLCERLLAQGQRVLCTDNFFTGRKANVAHLLDHPDFELLEHDVIIPLDREVGEIYNLACPASPIHYQYDPVQTTKTSVWVRSMCLNSLHACKPVCFKPPPLKYMETRRSTHNPNTIGGMLIPSVCARATTKVSAALKRSSLISISNTNSKLKSLAFLIPMGRACIRRMVVSSLILLCKPCKANHHDLWRWQADPFLLLLR